MCGFLEAGVRQALGAPLDGFIQRVAIGTEVDQGCLVAELAVPDRTSLLGAGKCELSLARSAAGVWGARGEARGEPPPRCVHLRREGNVEEDSVEVHAGPGIQDERRLRRARYDLLGPFSVAGGPPLNRPRYDA